MMAMTTESTTGASMGSNGSDPVVGGSGGVGGGPSDTGAVQHSHQIHATPSVADGSPGLTHPRVDALLGQSEEQRTEAHP